MTNIEIIRAYIAAFEAKDLDGIIAMTAPDIVYHNIPMEVVLGRESFAKLQGPFIAKMDRVEWELLNIAETSDGYVLTERIDRFYMKDKREISVRCMGIFELRDGLVARWRDYFDMAEFKPELPQS